MLRMSLPAAAILFMLTDAAGAMCGAGGMGGARMQCGGMPGMKAEGTAPGETPDAGTRSGGMMHSMPGMKGGMMGGMRGRMMAGCGCCGGSSGGMCGGSGGMMQQPGAQHGMPHDPMFDENPQSTPAPKTPAPTTPAPQP